MKKLLLILPIAALGIFWACSSETSGKLGSDEPSTGGQFGDSCDADGSLSCSKGLKCFFGGSSKSSGKCFSPSRDAGDPCGQDAECMDKFTCDPSEKKCGTLINLGGACGSSEELYTYCQPNAVCTPESEELAFCTACGTLGGDPSNITNTPNTGACCSGLVVSDDGNGCLVTQGQACSIADERPCASQYTCCTSQVQSPGNDCVLGLCY